MLGNLLIFWENGRTTKTYGINFFKIYNMKNYFVWIVILLLCMVRASYEFQYYPDTKFGLSREPPETRRFDTSDELPPYLYRSNYGYEPDENVKVVLPDRFKKITRFLNERAAKLKAYVDSKSLMKIPDDITDTHDFETIISDFNELTKHFRPPYVDESNDFEFRDNDVNEDVIDDNISEDEEDEIKNDDELGMYRSRLDNILRSNEDDGKLVIESSGRQPSSDDKFEEVDFAYAPGDPRFYKTTTRLGIENPLNINYKIPKIQTYDPLKNINIKVRNDEERIKVSETTQSTTETKTEASVDIVPLKPTYDDSDTAGVYIIAVVAGISAAATVALIAFGIGWYNLQKHVKNASDVEYPAYGVTGPNKEVSPSGDRRLAQSAQMYHYQHQKQQIIAMESRAAANDRHGSMSEADSEEENEEGDYTVYECPGLAPTGEMEVKNPLFQDDPTPAQTPAVKSGDDVQKK